MLKAGVHVLDNKSITIRNKSGESIEMIGLDDYSLRDSTLSQIIATKYKDTFKVLLAHQAELFEYYSSNNVDLVFSGHLHGGQFRLPFIGGLLAPGKGLFPKYTSGRYDQNGTTMYVSRGLGNSIIPIRVFNRPEVVVVRLNH